MTGAPIEVGVVGAGPWAAMVHAPTFAAGPETRLAGVWARRPEAAERLASRHHVPAIVDLDELFERCDAVAFAVPPDVQAPLAARAARAGLAVILEKPIAGDVAGAVEVATAVEEAGVASLVVLSWRYAPAVRRFLDAAATTEVSGGSGRFLSGGALAGPFATPWRLERGPLLDLGPHVVDLLDAAMGQVTAIHAFGDRHGWVDLVLEHRGGTSSSVALCATTPIDPSRAGVELYGPAGVLEIDCTAAVDGSAFATLRRQLVQTMADGGGHPLDVRRGLHLQRLLHDAEQQLLATGGG
ncbi:MAG: oxidoreductase [uncultured Acidimicrobiales bacterium]|uniref:Oxidoreductase n=1 Tax=uncultured Acidimicrobiales bacterium TaxID=310071 RepID=A0A6J4IGG4_9ACTN|nr:MAG: oxidoreductase [uncultured Acidimicrobiales bacterium]